jgi:hypothetical protein
MEGIGRLRLEVELRSRNCDDLGQVGTKVFLGNTSGTHRQAVGPIASVGIGLLKTNDATNMAFSAVFDLSQLSGHPVCQFFWGKKCLCHEDSRPG